MTERRRIWITGIGVITAIGTGKEAFRAGLRAGRSPVTRIDRFDPSEFRSQVAAQVDDFDPLAWMPPKIARQLDRFSQFGLVAGRLALDDAGLTPGERGGAHPQRIGIYLGLGARRHRLRRVAARALPREGHPPGGPEPGARGLRRRGAGQPRHRARRPRADPVDGQLVRVGCRRARRGARGPARGADRRGDRRRRRDPAQPARLRGVRHHPGPVGRPQRRAGHGGAAVRRGPRWLRHGRGRGAPGPRGRPRRPRRGARSRTPSCWATARRPTPTTWSSRGPTGPRPPARPPSRSTTPAWSPTRSTTSTRTPPRRRSGTSPRPGRSPSPWATGRPACRSAAPRRCTATRSGRPARSRPRSAP